MPYGTDEIACNVGTSFSFMAIKSQETKTVAVAHGSGPAIRTNFTLITDIETDTVCDQTPSE
jgi:hypothetical protein